MAVPTWDTSSRISVGGSNYAHTTPEWSGVTIAPTVATDSNGLRVGWATSGVAVVGTVYGGRRTYSAALDLSDYILSTTLIFTPNGFDQGNLWLALFSTSGAKRWVVTPGNSSSTSISILFQLDPLLTTLSSEETGTFDITDVIAHEWHIYCATSNSRVLRIQNTGTTSRRALFAIPRSSASSYALTGGEVGNVASFEPLSSATGFPGVISVDSGGNVPHPPGFAAIDVHVRINCDLFENNFFYFVKRNLLQTLTGFTYTRQIEENFEELFFDVPASGVNTINDSLYYGGEHGVFKSAVGAGGTLTFNRSTIGGFLTVLLNDLTFKDGVISGATSLVVDNCDLDNVTVSCEDAVFEVVSLGSNTLLNISLPLTVLFQPAAGGYADVDASLANDSIIEMSGGGGSYDFSGLSGGSLANPVIFDAVDGGTYTISISSNLVAEVADPVTSGTITLVAPTPTLELTNLVAGSRIYVFNTTDSVVLFNEIEATTSWAESVPSGKALLIRVRNASGSPKYKPYQTTTGALLTGVSIVVNQELDE